jgi:aspartyl/glutamyl-tRNA(Asn/Gln) amidotransferase C subunit
MPIEPARIARLARLDPECCASDVFVDELNRILDFVSILDSLESPGGVPSPSVVVPCPFREDLPEVSSEAHEDLTGAASDAPRWIRVPKIITRNNPRPSDASGEGDASEDHDTSGGRIS